LHLTILFIFRKKKFEKKKITAKFSFHKIQKLKEKTLLNLLNHINLLVKGIDYIYYDSGCSNCSSFHKPLLSFLVHSEGTLWKLLLSVEERYGMFSSRALCMVKPLCRPFIPRMASPRSFTEHFFLSQFLWVLSLFSLLLLAMSLDLKSS